MKLKEVCVQTGLTERAVRFYVQEKLVVPLAQRRGGRTWLDFSPADVERLRESIESYERLCRTDTGGADGLEDYAALLEREVKSTPLPRSDFRPASRLNWESILETLCMILCVLGALRLYAFLWDTLSDASFYVAFAAWNPLMVILPFLVLILPIALVVGSKLGKWFYRHFEYVP